VWTDELYELILFSYLHIDIYFAQSVIFLTCIDAYLKFLNSNFLLDTQIEKSWFNYNIKNVIQKRDKSYRNATRQRIFTTILNQIENWSIKPLQRRNEITTYTKSDIQKTIKLDGKF